MQDNAFFRSSIWMCSFNLKVIWNSFLFYIFSAAFHCKFFANFYDILFCFLAGSDCGTVGCLIFVQFCIFFPLGFLSKWSEWKRREKWIKKISAAWKSLVVIKVYLAKSLPHTPTVNEHVRCWQSGTVVAKSWMWNDFLCWYDAVSP